jgi:hypothetical protein
MHDIASSLPTLTIRWKILQARRMLHANRKYPNTLAPARLIGSRTAICLILARTSMDQGIVVSLEKTDTGTNAKVTMQGFESQLRYSTQRSSFWGVGQPWTNGGGLL